MNPGRCLARVVGPAVDVEVAGGKLEAQPQHLLARFGGSGPRGLSLRVQGLELECVDVEGTRA